MEEKRALLGMTLQEMEQTVTSLGMPRFTARQLAQWIYQKNADSFEAMTNLSQKNRALLSEQYVIGKMHHTERLESVDGTVKYLFPTAGGESVEAVFIPEADRGTLCVSSQVGCRMGCRFCMTGRQGFQGNCSATDILNQIYALPEWERLTNIVFMGQGEPMDNLEAVLRATELLMAPYSLGWSPRRITVSTVGIRGAVEEFVTRRTPTAWRSCSECSPNTTGTISAVFPSNISCSADSTIRPAIARNSCVCSPPCAACAST